MGANSPCVRILLPHGSGFILKPIKKSGQDRSRANLSVGSEQLIEATFDTSISEDADNSNLLFSLKDASTAGQRVLLGVLSNSAYKKTTHSGGW